LLIRRLQPSSLASWMVPLSSKKRKSPSLVAASAPRASSTGPRPVANDAEVSTLPNEPPAAAAEARGAPPARRVRIRTAPPIEAAGSPAGVNPR
jgi:hypothetical protein